MTTPEFNFPPYAYIPGGPWPHPTRTPAGHSHHEVKPLLPAPIDPNSPQSSTEYRRAVAYWNAGYYWEAHEVWEGLWHAHGRKGSVADMLRALIKLAAAGVKVREGLPIGVETHASRAGDLFMKLQAEVGEEVLGLSLSQLIEFAEAIRRNPPQDSGRPDASVTRVFQFQLRLGRVPSCDGLFSQPEAARGLLEE